MKLGSIEREKPMPKLILHPALAAFTAGLTVGLVIHLLICAQQQTREDHWTPPQSKRTSKNANNAKQQSRSVRIFCWIVTEPRSHWSKAVHVRDTWARRCDRVLFMSTAAQAELPAVALNVTEGYQHLWGKTKAALLHLYKHHLNEADYFLKADDDTYVIMDNLRLLLSKHRGDSSVMLGRRFRPHVRGGYCTGGAGYVLSHEALRRFGHSQLSVEKMHKKIDCPTGTMGPEDVNIAKCMHSLGVRIADTLDAESKETFHAFDPARMLSYGYFSRRHWIWAYSFYPFKLGPDCCSRKSISFHYVTPQFMRMMDFLIYELKTDRTEQAKCLAS